MINVAIFASGEGTNVENLIKYFSTGKEVKIKLIVTNKPEAGVVKRAEAYKKNIFLLSKEPLSKFPEQSITILHKTINS